MTRFVLIASLGLTLLPFIQRPPVGVHDVNEYDVSRIPPLLASGADAVVRENLIEFRVKDEQRSTIIVTRAVTVFNKSERERYGRLFLWYDEFRDIENLDGELFDAQGEKIRSLEDSDIKDYSEFADYSLYEDSRVRIASMFGDQYPYTVEYKYEISYKGVFTWPTWYAQPTVDPVEISRFDVTVPRDHALRYWCSRDSINPQIETEGSRTHYRWKAEMLPKLSRDQVGDAEDVTTVVRIAPSEFRVEDWQGSMKSWKDLGGWYYRLTIGKDKLPPAAVQQVHRLVDTLANVRAKVDTLYKYMQSHTRYVNVSLGIGGWQPFDASYVYDRGYGDCKALTNYMKALLEEAGINAYAVLIDNGGSRDELVPEFPSNQFNHVILCVPFQQDSLWLECTSQTIPTGQISESNEDRWALMISSDGGSLVRTPSSRSRDNRQTRVASVTLSPDGSARAESHTVVSGNQQNDVRSGLGGASPAEKEQWMLDDLRLPNVVLQKYRVEGIETHRPEISVAVWLNLPRFAAVSGSRLFFQPNLLERQTRVPPTIAVRLSPVRFSYPYLDQDSVYYRIPASMAVEALPSPASLSSSFGSFSSSTTALGDTALVFRRTLEISRRIIPPERYGEYRQFFADVVKADRGQVVLVNRNPK